MNKTMALVAGLSLAGAACANDAALDTRFNGDGRLTVAIDVAGTTLGDRAIAIAGLEFPFAWIVGTAASNAASGSELATVRLNRDSGVTSPPERFDPGFISIADARTSDFGLATLGTRMVDGLPHAAVHAIDYADVPRQSFGNAGLATLPGGAPTVTPLALAVASDASRTYVMLEDGSAGMVTRRVTLLGASGQVQGSAVLDDMPRAPSASDMILTKSGDVAFALATKTDSGCVVRVFGVRPPTATAKFPSRGLPYAFHASTSPTCSVSRAQLAEDAHGRLYLCTLTTDGYFFSRFSSDGSPDSQFGVKSFQTAPDDFFSFRHFDVQSDGKIVLGGSKGDGLYVSHAVLRLTATAQRDASFGSNGIARVDFPDFDSALAPTSDLAQITVDAQDRILGVGWSEYKGSDTDFAAFRLVGSRNIFRDKFE